MINLEILIFVYALSDDPHDQDSALMCGIAMLLCDCAIYLILFYFIMHKLNKFIYNNLLFQLCKQSL